MNSSHISDEQLIAYAAKELGNSESGLVRDHIATCSECNGTVVLFKQIRGLMLSDRGQDPSFATVARAHAIFRQPRLKPQPSRASFNWLPQLLATSRRFFAPAVTALTVLLILVFSQAIVASASESLPGDVLYPVKLNVEGLQVAFTLQKEDKANLLLDLAHKRTTEVATLKDLGRYDSIPIAITAYDNEVNQATGIVNDLAATNPDSASTVGSNMVQALNADKAMLASLASQLPSQAQAAVQNAISVSEKNSASVLNTITTLPVKPKANRTPTPTSTPDASLQPNRGATPPGKPTDKPNPPNVGKPTDKPKETPVAKPTDKPKETPPGKQTDKPNPTPPGKPTDKPNNDNNNNNNKNSSSSSSKDTGKKN